jgi:hypothetical protein
LQRGVAAESVKERKKSDGKSSILQGLKRFTKNRPLIENERGKVNIICQTSALCVYELVIYLFYKRENAREKDAISDNLL